MTAELTDEERDRFATWLEREAQTDADLLKQMEKLSGATPLIKQRRAEIAAALIIARKLRSIESQSIGG